MEQEIDYSDIFDRKKNRGAERRDTYPSKGLNDQAIRIGFLDRDKSGRPLNFPDGNSATANAMADYESHLPR